MSLLARRRDQVIVKEVRQTYRDVPVGPSDVVLDLGANIGAASLFLLEKGAGRVIAVEPDPVSFGIAQRNLPSRRAVTIWAAVGPTTGRTVLYVSRDRPYLTSKLPDKGRRAVRVPMVTLGGLCRMYGPTIVKCDIEFGEYDLPELFNLPDHVRVLAMEIHVRADLVTSTLQSEPELREQRRKAAALIAGVEAQGFRVIRRKDKLAKSGPIHDDTGLAPLVKSVDAIWQR